MDILWTAAGICAIVFVAFFMLAQHWRNLLREQSRAIRRLNQRLRDVQEVVDPEFRQHLSESSPPPLDKVFHFTFGFDDSFWCRRLKIPAGTWDLLRSRGTLLSSLKLEVWRSHMVASVSELLPGESAGEWQARSIDFYPGAAQNDFALLWEFRMAVPSYPLERVPTLELILRPTLIELRVSLPPANISTEAPENPLDSVDLNEDVILMIPLDHDMLTKYRTHDPTEPPTRALPMAEGLIHGSGWQTFYAHDDRAAGIQWHARLVDLRKKAQWERWRILDSSGHYRVHRP